MRVWRFNSKAALAALLLAHAAGCSGGDMNGREMNTRQPPKPNVGGASGNGPASGGASGNGFSNPTTQPMSAGRTMTMSAPGPCKNLQCQQRTTCAGNAATSISGTVFDPGGKNPIYNAVVYVPNEPLLPLKSGATCDDCDSLYSGHPIAAALTDSAGKFTMPKAPVGSNIPLVVQIGKWRRQFTVPTVTACQDNAMPDGMLRLPRNRMEGDIPNIAISTGSADTLECLLRRVGVDSGEYTPGHDGEGRVHIFAGTPRDGRGGGGDDNIVPDTSPPAPKSPASLWDSLEHLMRYDIVLLSCEGQETSSMNQQALHDYASAGGRVFASHFHYSWFNSGPYASENLATWTPESNDIGDIQGEIVTTLANGMPFPKGIALKEWLQNVNALQNGTLPIQQARHNADVSAANTPSQPWIVASQSTRDAPGATQYFSFNTPTTALNQADSMFCGRVVFSDLHVGAASGDDPMMPVPMSCTDNALSAQEAALEFMLFDLSSCLIPDDVPPEPPVVE